MSDPVLPSVLPSVVPEHVRTLLVSDAWGSDSGTLAIETVRTQLANHETRRIQRARVIEDLESNVPSLFDAAAEKFASSIGEDAEDHLRLEAMESLTPDVLDRIALILENIPYDKFCRAKKLLVGEDAGDADEWVLRNEVWLRESSTSDRPNASKRFRGDGETIKQGPQNPNWGRGLVRLSTHAEVVFKGSVLTDTCRTITRPMSLSGFKVLDGRRSTIIRIQPSVELFSKTFETMTGGLLNGLDWDHVFVAGGIALGALLCTGDKETTNSLEQWKSSDVDLYIHGLPPIEANKKIEHIFSVYKSNLPKDAPTLVVRNSKTITFFSSYPLRRIQVVLKLVDSPKDVLLNFDLDICAVGWDGTDVWMLPRAARAIETGYTVFTMDLINGHYLGDRRATQEQRVFKYADKGYGIRILPSYLTELKNYLLKYRTDYHHTTFDSIVIRSDDLQRADPLQVVHPPYVDQELDFDKLVENARKWTATAIKGIAKSQRRTSIPKISHAWLQERIQISEDPQRRSVLSGLSLFMRHVALWEHEVAGQVIIEKNTWAAPLYDDLYLDQFGISYNDTPDYSWDDSFTTKGFITNMADFNQKEYDGLAESIYSHFENSYPDEYIPSERLLEMVLVKGFRTQRIVYADSVQKVLQPKRDLYLPIWLPENFIKFANDLIPKAVRDSGMPSYTTKPLIQGLKDDLPASHWQGDSDDLELFVWRITDITMWQQLSRTIDEVHEVLWSFHHANAGLRLDKDDRMRLLVNQISRRVIRLTEKDEYGEFVRWVGRPPAGFSNHFNRYVRYLSQCSDDEEDEDGEDEDEEDEEDEDEEDEDEEDEDGE